jgi:hypothetical protein
MTSISGAAPDKKPGLRSSQAGNGIEDVLEAGSFQLCC